MYPNLLSNLNCQIKAGSKKKKKKKSADIPLTSIPPPLLVQYKFVKSSRNTFCRLNAATSKHSWSRLRDLYFFNSHLFDHRSCKRGKKRKERRSNSSWRISQAWSQTRTDPNRTEQNRTEQTRTEQNRTEQNRTVYSVGMSAGYTCAPVRVNRCEAVKEDENKQFIFRKSSRSSYTLSAGAHTVVTSWFGGKTGTSESLRESPKAVTGGGFSGGGRERERGAVWWSSTALRQLVN